MSFSIWYGFNFLFGSYFLYHYVLVVVPKTYFLRKENNDILGVSEM